MWPEAINAQLSSTWTSMFTTLEITVERENLASIKLAKIAENGYILILANLKSGDLTNWRMM